MPYGMFRKFIREIHTWKDGEDTGWRPPGYYETPAQALLGVDEKLDKVINSGNCRSLLSYIYRYNFVDVLREFGKNDAADFYEHAMRIIKSQSVDDCKDFDYNIYEPWMDEVTYHNFKSFSLSAEFSITSGTLGMMFDDGDHELTNIMVDYTKKVVNQNMFE